MTMYELALGVLDSCLAEKGLTEYHGNEKNTMIYVGKIHTCLINWSFVRR